MCDCNFPSLVVSEGVLVEVGQTFISDMTYLHCSTKESTIIGESSSMSFGVKCLFLLKNQYIYIYINIYTVIYNPLVVDDVTQASSVTISIRE